MYCHSVIGGKSAVCDTVSENHWQLEHWGGGHMRSHRIRKLYMSFDDDTYDLAKHHLLGMMSWLDSTCSYIHFDSYCSIFVIVMAYIHV